MANPHTTDETIASPDSDHTPLLGRKPHDGSPVLRSRLRKFLEFLSPGDGEQSEVDPDPKIFVRQRSRLSSYPSIQEFNEKSEDESRNNESGDAQLEHEGKYINVGVGRFWLIFSTIVVGYFVACFDTTLIASTHPIIMSYFEASKAASFLTSSFMITNTGFQPLWGRLSDTIGRKPVYLLVLTIFGLTNLWCALSDSIASFIAARTVCGLGAGGTMSMGLVMLNDLVRIEHRGVYYSYINLAFGLGSACGAAFGGLICDAFGSWRWTFGIQVPVIATCALAALLLQPSSMGPMLLKRSRGSLQTDESPAWNAVRTFDHAGLLSLVFSVSCIVLFLNLGGNILPWTSPIVITCLVLGSLGVVAFVLIERRAIQPVMPLNLLTSMPIANLVYANLLAGIASNTILFNVPLWFQAVKLTSATTSGLRLAAPAIAGPIAGMATGYIITYTKRLKPTLLFGGIVYVLGSVALCLISERSSTAVSLLLITGAPLGQGFVYPNTMMSSFAVSERSEQAVVTTTIGLWRNLGIVLGVAISSLVFQNSLASQLEKTVHGREAHDIIRRARNSVESVRNMAPRYQLQVINSYAAALKLTFVTALVASLLLLIVIIPARLPRLSREKLVASAAE